MNPLLKDIFAEARAVIDAARAKGLRIGTAESCTGGLIGAALTAIPGSSDSFEGGIIAYNGRVKQALLGVAESVLKAHGEVSRETAEAMARGAFEALDVDLAVSVTGIAGPGGGSDEKPVGTVWIGIAGPDSVAAELFQYGDIGRNRVRDLTCLDALRALRAALD